MSIDFFTVPTATFAILFVFMVLLHDRRRIVHISVTAQPTASWAEQQIREAFPRDTGPRHSIRGRDGIYDVTYDGMSAAGGSADGMSTITDIGHRMSPVRG